MHRTSNKRFSKAHAMQVGGLLTFETIPDLHKIEFIVIADRK